MTPAKERWLLGLLLVVAPVALYFLFLRSAIQHMDGLQGRLQQFHAESPFQSFSPVGREERAFLEVPDAPWRTRIPVLTGDGARLAHVHRVVNELNATLRAGGIKVAGLRASWDPVEARFTLPAQLTQGAVPVKAVKDAPEFKVEGWVLVVEIGGATSDLFKALALVPRVNALLEPVGLRWGRPGDAVQQDSNPPAQYLILRNVYLKP